jgi:hypothetical protein
MSELIRGLGRVRWYLLPFTSLAESNYLDIVIFLKLEKANCIISPNSAGDAVDAIVHNSLFN